jgi:putative SOS response-associated peptidase YedK
VLPVSGFYEWKKDAAGGKQPYYITRADGQPVYFAGLWDCWRDELESCTILTCRPNAEMAKVHSRMPCILEPERIAGWLSPEMEDPEQVAGFLAPAADGVLQMHPVSRRVNNARNQLGEELTAPEPG